MIGLDTTVLLRYLTQDDAKQSARATHLIERKLSADNPGFVSAVVLAEVAWVLKRAYRLSDRQIAAVIERILQTEVLSVEHEQEVFTAAVLLKQGKGSFADALIGALARRAGCLKTFTLDRKALRLPGFELL